MPDSDFVPSAQQLRIFHWAETSLIEVGGVETEFENAVVVARAGTGKTTTMVGALPYLREVRAKEDVLFAAFNKTIADELNRRLMARQIAGVTAKTLHGVGYGFVSERWQHLRALGRNAVDPYSRKVWLTEMACRQLKTEDTPIPVKRCINEAHIKARELRPHATTPEQLVDLIFEYSNDCLPDAEWTNAGFDINFIVSHALAAMVIAAERPTPDAELRYNGEIDYADMLYLPLRNKWLRKKFKAGILDEAQDVNAPQVEMVRGVVDGRICAVGDDRQAIYGWRGADSDALSRLKSTLAAGVLPLTRTYRCGKVITRHAARLVPDFEHADTNPEGAIELVNKIEEMITKSGPGDFILSRKKAPMASIAMAMIRASKRVAIRGKQIGKGLEELAKKLAKGSASNSVPMFLQKLQTWQEKECARAIKGAKNEDAAYAKCDEIRDTAETLAFLCDGVVSVGELVRRIGDLFTDSDKVETLTLISTIHKAKGLEAKRVFVLCDTLYPNIPAKFMTPGRELEEENLEYVACTRAIDHLFLVSEQGFSPRLLPVAEAAMQA